MKKNLCKLNCSYGKISHALKADKFQIIFTQFSDWTGHVSEKNRRSV